MKYPRPKPTQAQRQAAALMALTSGYTDARLAELTVDQLMAQHGVTDRKWAEYQLIIARQRRTRS